MHQIFRKKHSAIFATTVALIYRGLNVFVAELGFGGIWDRHADSHESLYGEMPKNDSSGSAAHLRPAGGEPLCQ